MKDDLDTSAGFSSEVCGLDPGRQEERHGEEEGQPMGALAYAGGSVSEGEGGYARVGEGVNCMLMFAVVHPVDKEQPTMFIL